MARYKKAVRDEIVSETRQLLLYAAVEEFVCRSPCHASSYYFQHA